MTRPRRRNPGGWHLALGCRVLGYYAQVSFYPLGSWRRLLLCVGPSLGRPGSTAWHLFAGPVHAHGYYLGPKLLELEVDVAHDPFWGTAVRPPPGDRVVFGRIPRG